MSNKINDLETALKTLKTTQAKERSGLETELSNAYTESFKVDTALTKALQSLESSNEYGNDETGIYSWVRFDLSGYAECMDELEDYLCDHCAYPDVKNDVLLSYQGGSIVINDGYGRDKGDVYDTDAAERIVKKSDYQNEDTGELDIAKRNELIEAYMERTGCYPGVFRCDDHGNVYPINTVVNSER